VRAQNQNALELAHFLANHTQIKKVFYPGLASHPEHELSKKQMKSFGGMLSFELTENINIDTFLKSLKIIKPSMSLAGVESTILSPTKTSHSLLTAEEQRNQGISDGLLRFSVGIEDVEDLIEDLKQAIENSK
jgi:cystathionine beta-lyase